MAYLIPFMSFFRLFLVLAVLGLSWPLVSLAQDKYTISGTVKDARNGETMVGTNVYIDELKKGATTNVYGFYSITVPAGTYTLKVSYLGYDTYEKQVELKADVRLDIPLKAGAIEQQEVVVTGEKQDKNVSESRMSTVELQMAEVKGLPVLAGEVDIIKTLTLMPGVQSGGEGNTGLYVRGGGPDQNLILLDEAVVYNASHLFGFLSVFNADAIKGVELTKGGIPAQYGGRLASVVDITMKDGNDKQFEVEGGIGVVSSRLTVQGPIKKEKASFLLSGRGAYAGLLVPYFIPDDSNFQGTKYGFYDLNAKVNWTINDKNRLFLSGYFGRDVFGFSNKESGFSLNIPWGNATATLRWNHIIGPKMFVNTSLIYSDYDFSFEGGQAEFDLKLFSGIRDFNVKTDINWLPDPRHNVKFGANYIYHIFTPSNAEARTGDTQLDLGAVTRYHGHEAAIYIQDDFDVTDKLRINGGLRASMFAHVGPFDRYVKNEFNQITDTISYGPQDDVAIYPRLEPRLSVRYMVGKHNSIKASYTMNYQYIHLATISSIALPTDTWMPSTDLLPPTEGHQWALGYFHNFFDNKLETSVEGYYKIMSNLVEYKQGVIPGDNIRNNPDQNLTTGSGNSYGAEFFIRKNGKKLTGWIGYTLSWTNRTFAELNYGNTFPATYDRRHDLSVVAMYNISKRVSVSAVFVYATGNAITLPVARYFIDGAIVNEYSDRNSYRMGDYHRLDLGCTIHPNPKKQKRFKSTWNISIYNVYSRQNPYFYYFDTDVDGTTQQVSIKAKQVSLFPIIPSVTWNFKF